MSTDKPIEVRERAGDGADWLNRTTPQDFDGHTRFAHLNADQRLEWLQRTADLMRDLQGQASRRRSASPRRDLLGAG